MTHVTMSESQITLHWNTFFGLFVADALIHVTDCLPRNTVALEILYSSSLNLSRVGRGRAFRDCSSTVHHSMELTKGHRDGGYVVYSRIEKSMGIIFLKLLDWRMKWVLELMLDEFS